MMKPHFLLILLLVAGIAGAKLPVSGVLVKVDTSIGPSSPIMTYEGIMEEFTDSYACLISTHEFNSDVFGQRYYKYNRNIKCGRY